MYNLCDSIITCASLLEPFMPRTAQAISEQLNCQLRSFDKCKESGLYPVEGHVTDAPTMLFARLKLEDIMVEVEKIREAQKPKDAQPEEEKPEEPVIDIEPKEEIEYGDFAKLQFQVGEIIACEEVKKSKKLLCSQVKIGSQVKQIVSGIKQHYTAEEMVGKKVMVLVNLKPATLAGVMSEGMLLCAEDAEGNLALMTPEKSMPSGAEIC